MSGEKIKSLREAKCWSQAHLADASRLNIRTIQRIEAGEPCSQETLLSLAAAIGVDVSELATDVRTSASTRGTSRGRIAAAALLTAPAALFVAVNLLRSVFGFALPYDTLAAAGGSMMSSATFNLISPFLFVGGLVAALVLILSSVIHFRSRMDGASLTICAVHFALRPLPWTIVIVAAASGASLAAYVVAESIGPALR